ncbi:MAG: enoyl-CoA hydratase/isomerase family protein [Granulosicoccus sp.]|nr:enoyl-CoA hydratase/isomerase family protein [Granulosicoccus sp.]
MYQCFNVVEDGAIVHIQLARPEKRNSMIASFWSELYTIVDEIDRQARARVIVISSLGPHFSSGMDISVFQSIASTESSLSAENSAPESAEASARADSSTKVHVASRFYGTVMRLQRVFTRLERCRIPVLVAVQGGCVGAALDLITACDCRYATDDAYFTIYETNLAMTADVGTFPRICKLIPDGLVRELAYTGRALSAQEAAQAGLVNQLYADADQLLAAVMEVAQTIASKAPVAVHGCKKMILHSRDHSVAETLEHVALWSAGFFEREDILEALSANAEQRAGQYTSLPPMPADDDTDTGIEL